MGRYRIFVTKINIKADEGTVLWRVLVLFQIICQNKKRTKGLSCSFALNVSAVFLFRNFVPFKETTFALCSLALEPRQDFVLWRVLVLFQIIYQNKKRTKGLEPSTSTLGRLHSTTELRPHIYIIIQSLLICPIIYIFIIFFWSKQMLFCFFRIF